MRHSHDMRFGARLLPDGGALFSLWAPAAVRVELMLQTGPDSQDVLDADAHGDGWYGVRRALAAAGQRYRWRIDGELAVPDPASRWNPEGPHGPSELIDPLAHVWDAAWTGRPWHEAVFYELHVGTFTAEGTYAAAAVRLPELAALGITAVQLMPLGDFPGRFGWGYDGVLPFAPYHGYGRPEALKALVQAAHDLGLMIFADVVYNHFGPDGNYLHAYAPQFFSSRHQTAWGKAINFDEDGAETVRSFFVDNALYWLEEYRFDGLRLDAVHAMLDDRRPDILQTLSATVRERCAGRHVHLVLENDSNDRRRLDVPATPGRYDGQWSGDVHHTLHVLLTGERDGYYAEYDDPVAQLGRSLSHGFAREGGPHNAEGAVPRRAAHGSVPLGATVNCLQNHDQVGNRAFGERLLALAPEPAAVRLAAAIVCLAPSTPMLFMGEEQGADSPFLYFADWQGELRDAVRAGRQAEFSNFSRYVEAARSGRLPDPCSADTVRRCVPTRRDAVGAQAWRHFYTALLQRRADGLRPRLPLLRAYGHDARHDGHVLQLRWFFDVEASRGRVASTSEDLPMATTAARSDSPSKAPFEVPSDVPPAVVTSPPSPARLLLMRVNLAPRPALATPQMQSDAAIGTPPPGGGTVFTVGEADGHRLGAWSGVWQWLDLPTTPP